MPRRRPIPARLLCPIVWYGSWIREFRVRVGLSVQVLGQDLGYRSGLAYMRAIEDPPRGIMAHNIERGRWWLFADEHGTHNRHEKAQQAAQRIWRDAEEKDRAWLRALATVDDIREAR